MGARETHLAQAERNQKTIDYLLLKPTEFSEWITSIAFYKALHLIEATFEHHHCHDHGYRLNLLKLLAKTNKSYIIIFDRFRTLMTASCIARYLEQKETVGKKKPLKNTRLFPILQLLKKFKMNFLAFVWQRYNRKCLYY